MCAPTTVTRTSHHSHSGVAVSRSISVFLAPRNVAVRGAFVRHVPNYASDATTTTTTSTYSPTERERERRYDDGLKSQVNELNKKKRSRSHNANGSICIYMLNKKRLYFVP